MAIQAKAALAARSWLLAFALALSSTAALGECRTEVELLLGRWVSESDDRTFIEHWVKVSDDTFEGYGEVLDGEGARVAYESLRLVTMSSETFYIAKVKDNDMPTPFRLVHCGDGELRFENPAHDFPKSLTYRAAEDASLSVRVSGDPGQGFEIHFIRDAAEYRKHPN